MGELRKVSMNGCLKQSGSPRHSRCACDIAACRSCARTSWGEHRDRADAWALWWGLVGASPLDGARVLSGVSVAGGELRAGGTERRAESRTLCPQRQAAYRNDDWPIANN